jgi:uncharacterized protein involved in cysteine biosynthesis
MLKAIGRTLSQLTDPGLFSVIIMSVVGAAIVLIAVWAGMGVLIGKISISGVGWLDWLARFAIGVGMIFVTIALFSAIAAAIAGLFVGRVANEVERRFYPGLPPTRTQSVPEQIGSAFSFLVAVLVLNILFLPLYVLWGANIPIFLGLNGYLLGRQYFELVALRRVDRHSARRLWRTHRPKLMTGGLLIAGFSFIPFSDLLTPVLATAFMLHILQSFPEFKGSCEGEHFGVTPSSPFHRP